MLKKEEFFMMKDLYSHGMSVGEISRYTGIDVLYDLAAEKSEIGQYEEAIQAHIKIMNETPDYPGNTRISPWNMLIIAGQDNEGYQEYKYTKIMDPDNASTSSEIGDFLREIGGVDEALRVFGNAQKIESNSSELSQKIGDIFHGKGMNNEAIEEYRKAIRQRWDEAELMQGWGDQY